LNIRACPAFIPDELEFMILHRRIQVVKWGWRSLDGNREPESYQLDFHMSAWCYTCQFSKHPKPQD
jgi:hypothetical protein